MKLPTIKGIIKRRVLINYRADPDIVQKILPKSFKPKLKKTYAIAGICLIRLEQMRPNRFPKLVGISSENAAHRVAIEWEENGEVKEGVFIPRRDTDSTLNHIAGGTIFPGEHSKATFEIKEADEIDFSMKSEDEEVSLSFRARHSDEFPTDSVFPSLQEASRFFEKGSLGYSPNKIDANLDGISLDIQDWKVSPLEILSVESSFYNNEQIFPQGSIEFDHALLMRDIAHKWNSTRSFALEN